VNTNLENDLYVALRSKYTHLLWLGYSYGIPSSNELLLMKNEFSVTEITQ